MKLGDQVIFVAAREVRLQSSGYQGTGRDPFQYMGQ